MKKILVTGASSGIGEATAILAAQKGFDVLMAARRKDRLDEIIAQNKNISGKLQASILDVSKKESIDAFIQQNMDWLKTIDVLMNNAGLALGRDSLQNTPHDDIKTMLDTNVYGLLELSRQILPLMVSRQCGDILNLGSVAGRTAYKGGTVYCATKAAVDLITDCLRYDVAGTGVRVSNIEPGRVETEFSEVRFKGDKESAKKVYQGFRPLKPKDIAETALWIVDRPRHVNIQNVLILSTDQINATEIMPMKEP